jgi:hypothetical protein
MVAGLDDSRVEVNVFNVLIGRCVFNKYPSEVIVVKFGTTFACSLDAHARTKDSEAGEVGFEAIVTFKRGTFGFRLYEAVVEVHTVLECVRPIFSWKTRSVQ